MLRNGYYLLSSYFPRDNNIKITDTYSEISDGDLDSAVKEITSANPNIGYRGVKSHLEARNLRIKYHRVRQSLLRVDAAAVALRFGNTVKRRVYSVPCPNALWHIDGHHKLIR